MANEVFANGRELACKAGSGKTIAAFPDTCFTPPENPATPPGVPVPYPNTGKASDTTKGSKKVMISGKEIMLKDSSYFKTSMGDEAGCAAKKGVITSTNKGKVYFQAWSMDVKFEGENVDRHLDMTTNNHASQTGDTPPWAYQDMPAALQEKCEAQHDDTETACAEATPHMEPNSKGKMVQKGLDCPPGCAEAKACVLISKKNDKNYCCHPDTTGHHLVEVHCFLHPGGRGQARDLGYRLDEYLDYSEEDAPCVCAGESTSDPNSSHAIMHDVQGQQERAYYALRMNDPEYEPHPFGGHPNDQSFWNYGEAREAGVMAHKKAFPHCEVACTRRQLDYYHQTQLGVDDSSPMRTDPVNRH